MKNKLIKRRLFSEILKLLKRKEIFAVVGPRQSGKTTLLLMISDYLKTKKKVPENRIFYFTFEDPLVLEEFQSNPSEFVKSRIKEEKTYFFFDEFHYTDNGGKKLKLLYDLFPKAKFFISGSSSLELTFQTAKYLVGRIFYFRLFPLEFSEFLEYRAPDLASSFLERQDWFKKFLACQEKASPGLSVFEKRFQTLWEEFVAFGGYPEVVKEKKPEIKTKILENIVSTYLQKEIRTLLLIKDLSGYQNLLKLLASQSGKLVNLNQLSNDTGLNFLNLKKNLKILEETFIIQRVSPFYSNLSSELRKTAKIYFQDFGLRNLLLSNFSSISARPDKGEIGESFVFQEIFKRINPTEKINFWRTRGGAEIDFVLTRGEEKIALEVKTSIFKKAKTSRALISFLNNYSAKRVVICNLNLWKVFDKKDVKFLFLPIWYT